MEVFPDVVFHRYFATLSPERRKYFRGKLNLAKPSLTGFEQLLVDIQDVLNDSLREASTDEAPTLSTHRSTLITLIQI
jgi:hypothetical protein